MTEDIKDEVIKNDIPSKIEYRLRYPTSEPLSYSKNGSFVKTDIVIIKPPTIKHMKYFDEIRYEEKVLGFSKQITILNMIIDGELIFYENGANILRHDFDKIHLLDGIEIVTLVIENFMIPQESEPKENG